MDPEKIVERREDLKRIDAWLVAHPWQAKFLALGTGILIFELSQFFRLALEAIGRAIGGAS